MPCRSPGRRRWPRSIAARTWRPKPPARSCTSPLNKWKIPEPGDLFNKDKSIMEQHREEQRSKLEWMHGWSQIKVQPQSKIRGKYVPKRPQIANTAENTLQEGQRPCAYTT